MKPHKHAELIKAWADGAKIEVYSERRNEWVLCESQPIWVDNCEYRIKPEPKPDIIKYFCIETHPMLGIRFNEQSINSQFAANLKITFDMQKPDGERPKIKSVEIINE